MFVIMVGAMRRYDDASGKMWRNIRFEADGSAFTITFDKRKNSQFRQGNKVLVAAFPSDTMCPVRLLQRLRIYTGGVDGLYVFRGFNRRLVSKIPGSTAPGPKSLLTIRYCGIWVYG